MNLFIDESIEFLKKLNLKEDWIQVLAEEGLEAGKMQELMTKLKEERAKYKIYPASEDVLRLFKTLEFEKVRVVIVGQDPYHNGNANGIAFACKLMVSPSLKKIGEAIIANGYPNHSQRTKTLEYLVDQGVFLYNTILTVREGQPLSHKDIGWLHFTACVVAALNRKQDLIWVLWGNEAQNWEKYINKNHIIFKDEHPAAAARANREWKCDHFKRINNSFENRGLTKIDW